MGTKGSVVHTITGAVYQQGCIEITQELSCEKSGALQVVREGWLFTVKGST